MNPWPFGKPTPPMPEEEKLRNQLQQLRSLLAGFDGLRPLLPVSYLGRPLHEAAQEYMAHLIDSAFRASEAHVQTMEKLMAAQARIAELEAAPTQPANAEPVIRLNGHQLLAALDFIAPDRTDDQLETDACIQYGPARTDDGETEGPGYFCWYSEYPEEGSLFLDEAPVAQPAQAEQPKAAQQEPVNAWQIYGMDGDPLFIQQDEASANRYKQEGHRVERLAVYTAAAPQREPMTSEQAWDCVPLMEANAELGLPLEKLMLVVRAVERFHNITKKEPL